MHPELNLVWYNIDRLFQEIEIKCEMIDNAMEMLSNYKKSMEKTAEVMRHNLAVLSEKLGSYEQRNPEKRPQDQM